MRSVTRRPLVGSLREAALGLFVLLLLGGGGPAVAGTLIGHVVDAVTGAPVASRVYLEDDDGRHYFVQATGSAGSAVRYDVRRGTSLEVHTTLGAHAFTVDLPEGGYRLTIERGKEYRPLERKVVIGTNEKIELTFRLQRWIDMAARGWYSGDTHVHRSLEELPNLVLAEDLNVALPLSYWVTELEETPLRNSRTPSGPRPQPELVIVDERHVIWPVNTEYEIFTVNRKQHTLGAVFLLNHSEPVDLSAHPLREVAAEARRQGAILDLDKHNWPWSMVLLPVMNVDLFELTNNHLWRTEFLYSDWYPEYLPPFFDQAGNQDRYGEATWIEWGFANYYALLNCGFDLMPSGGTASGVHPVPLGFGRVYVYLGESFDFDNWMSGLAAGRSFVTTGPMLEVRCQGQLPGTRFLADERVPLTLRVEGTAMWRGPLDRVEILLNGSIVETILPAATSHLNELVDFGTSVAVDESSWLAVRCYGKAGNGRPRFAHSAPFQITVPGRPLRPKRDEVSYLVSRVEAELRRHEGVLSPTALSDYRDALRFYRSKLEEAR